MISFGMGRWILDLMHSKSFAIGCVSGDGQLLQDFPSFQGTIEQFAAGRHAPVAEAWGQDLARDCQWDLVADARQLCCP